MINQVYVKKWLRERGQQISLKWVFTLKMNMEYMTKECEGEKLKFKV